MGKQKGYRKIQGVQKKSDKKEVKASKLPPTLQVGSIIKNIERLIEEEIESASWRKKLSKSFRKELESYPLIAKAVYVGCEKAVDELLESEADVNKRLQDGSTPLMIAVEKGHITILQKLLKAGADLRLARNNGMNALMLAVSKNDNRIFSVLWDHLDKNDVWILNQENSDGYTILTIAVERGYVEYAKFFSSLSEVKVDHQTREGKSALMLAAMRSQSEIIKCLLERGASVHLEDMVGSTVLCAAFAQVQTDIVEMILETLTKKDRDIYVKKRVELLYRPRTRSSFEITYFYKKILFRVILSIKRLVENGAELLTKYKIFFALLKCIEMNKIDSELVWQALHLAAYLMYDTISNNSLVSKNMAELYAEANGLDFSLKTFSYFKNNLDVKEAALLPVQACCIECCQGKLWLKDNFCKIRKHLNEFKTNLPMLNFWLKEEVGKAKMVFDRFEVTVQSIIIEKEDLIVHHSLTPTFIDSLDSFGSSLESESPDDSPKSTKAFTEIKSSRRASSVPSSSSASVPVKKKVEVPRKVKNIKFHTKFEKKNKPCAVSQKINVNFPIEVFQNSSKKLNLPALSPQTGYADALKRNLDHKTEFELKAEQLLMEDCGSSPIKINTEKDFSMNQTTPGMVKHASKNLNASQQIYLSAEGDRVEKPVPKIKSYASVVSQKKGTKSKNTSKNVKSDCITAEQKNGKLYEISSLWNKVKEPSKLFSFITKLYPSLTSSENQNSSKHITHEDETECLHSSDSSFDPEEEITSEFIDYFDKVVNFHNSEDNSSEEKICPESNTNPFALHATQNYSLDFPSKEEHIDMEAENLFCLFESLDVEDPNPKNANLNYSRDNRNFDSSNEQLSRNLASKLEKDENALKYMLESEDTLQDCINKNVHSKRSDKNGRIDEKYRKASHRTYSEVARTGIDQSSKIGKNLLQDNANETKKKPLNLGVDDFSLDSSNESLELVNDGKQLEIELKTELPSSSIEHSGRKSDIEDMEDTSEEESEDIPQLRVSKRDESIYKNYCEREVGECHSYERKIDNNNQENKKMPPNFNEFSNETSESNGKNEITKGNYDFRLNGKFGIDTLGNKHKLICLESIRQKIMTLEDLNISPITCQKLLSLQKYLILYHRLFLHSFCSLGAKNFVLMPNLDDKFATNSEHSFVKPLKKKITLFVDSDKFPNVVIKVGKKSAVRVGTQPSEESNYIKFFNKSSKVATMKIHKQYSDFSQRKKNILTQWNDTEFKRKTAREDALARRRALIPGSKFNNEVNKNFYRLDSGFIPNFINCESDSKWYYALKGLQSCVPLGQFLVDSFSQGSTNTSNIHRLNSAAGKIVFGTNIECTLREGNFGTYTGLIVNTGTPVRIRQFTVSSFNTDKAAFSLSKNRLQKHEKLPTFHDAVINPKDFKMYLISELCEYSLPQYLKMEKMCHSQSRIPTCFFRKPFIIDLEQGIRYLHSMGIVHGHLKPSNIMVTSDYKLKIADYYLLDIVPLSCGIGIMDPEIRPIGAEISDFCWRPTELVLAENETDGRACINAASDIQMCGMLIFYILTGGKHPFGSSEQACQENIKQGQPVIGSYLKEPEARDLVCEMIKGDASARPSIDVVAKHPYFWDINKRFQFLLQVGRKITFFTSRPSRVADEFKESCIGARDWMSYVPSTLINFISSCTNTIYTNDFSDLLLFAVGLQDNFDFMPKYLKTLVVMPSHFVLLIFPTFFMSIFQVIRRSSVLQKQMELQAFF